MITGIKLKMISFPKVLIKISFVSLIHLVLLFYLIFSCQFSSHVQFIHLNHAAIFPDLIFLFSFFIVFYV